ncbi:MAG: hypothetical protein ABJB04_01750 [Betaproteobacteria bacterium]
MHGFFRFLGVISMLGICCGEALAAPGSLDRSFGAGFGYVRYADSANAIEDNGLGVATQPDAKIVVAGASGIAVAAAVVLRYNTDGTLDDGFGDHGVFRWKHETLAAIAQRVVVLSDGSLLVLGYVDTAEKLLFIRLHADGTLDTSYGTGGITIATRTGWFADVKRILIDDGGRPVVIWESINTGANLIRVSRFTTDGKIDLDYNFGAAETLINTSGFGAVTTLPFGAAFDPVGNLVIFASATNTAYNTTLIYRLGRDGYPDSYFGINGRVVRQQLNFAFSGHHWTVLAANGTGYVLVEWMAEGIRLEKFNLDGTVATAFGTAGMAFFPFPGATVIPNAFLTFPGANVTSGNALIRADGTILITGTRRPGTSNQAFLLGVTADGKLDTRLGTETPQRTYKGEDVGQSPGFIGADIALVNATQIAIAGSAVNAAGFNDILTLRVNDVGERDAAFGGNGIAVWDGGDIVPESAQGIWLQAGGKILTLNQTARGWNWRRFLADGSPDLSFGSGGKRLLNDAWDGPNVQIFTQSDGRIVVARQQVGPAFTNLTRVVRYLTDGARDLSFGSGGALDLIDDTQADTTAVRPGLAQLDDGRLLIATYGTGGLHLRRVLPGGGADVTFGGGNGIVFPPLHGRPQVGYTLAIQPDGRIVVGAATIVVAQLPLPQLNVYSDVVARLLPDGALDPTYGLQGGVVPIQIENARDPQILRILPLPDGKSIVAGNITRNAAQQFFFLRLNADGTIDNTYGDHTDGADGPGPFIWSDIYQTQLRDAVIDAAGRLVITGAYVFGPEHRTEAFVVRFLGNGTIDPSFAGIHQYIFLFERPEPSGSGNALALAPNAIFSAGDNGAYGLILKLEADGSAFTPSRPVLEFYNTLLNHYFITADPNEANAIDNGSAGPGWQRTGLGFRAWTASTGVPPSASPVCRFYGTPGIGPNSHFYTVNPIECDLVRQDPGWKFEGVAFYSVAPAPNGPPPVCPIGMQAVLRLYNNRFAENDSNHRYTTNSAVYQEMQQLGWLPEGVVLCSPTN